MRIKHGRYHQESHLPDNNSQPTGSGLYVWLDERIESIRPGLVAESQQHGNERYKWLIARLQEMPEPEAQSLVQEYLARRRKEQRERAQRDRRRHLAQYEKLAQTCDVERLDYVEKCIAKLQKQIAGAETGQVNDS